MNNVVIQDTPLLVNAKGISIFLELFRSTFSFHIFCLGYNDIISMFKSSIGCGYPPEVSCPSFAQKYSELKKDGKYFPCYYSKSSPWIVIERLDISISYHFNEN